MSTRWDDLIAKVGDKNYDYAFPCFDDVERLCDEALDHLARAEKVVEAAKAAAERLADCERIIDDEFCGDGVQSPTLDALRTAIKEYTEEGL